jgi:molybdenum cofactor guanylyltransferase
MIASNTYGIVLCGGQSSRMGTDKSLISYYNKPHRYHVYEMLQPFCEKVFISCNEKQSGSIDKGYDLITDLASYTGIGPIAALLTSFTGFPGKNILLVGCDYPFLTAASLQSFSNCCKGEAPVSFYNVEQEIYEPTLAWYPAGCFAVLKEMHKAKQYSLQHFLKTNNAVKFYPVDKSGMISIDTREDFAMVSAQLVGTGHDFF